MNIGETKRIIEVEPAEDPVPPRTPTPEPETVPETQPAPA